MLGKRALSLRETDHAIGHIHAHNLKSSLCLRGNMECWPVVSGVCSNTGPTRGVRGEKHVSSLRNMTFGFREKHFDWTKIKRLYIPSKVFITLDTLVTDSPPPSSRAQSTVKV